MMTEAPLQVMVELNRIQTTTDFRDELSRIHIRTLFIHGDRDASPSLKLTGKPAAAMIPGARVGVYEGAPHGLSPIKNR
jgi:non-heme chloroperoxidase